MQQARSAVTSAETKPKQCLLRSLQPVAALVDIVNDDFAVAFSEAMELIVSQAEFQDIMKADPIGISSVAGVAETDAGSKAWICYM